MKKLIGNDNFLIKTFSALVAESEQAWQTYLLRKKTEKLENFKNFS